MAIIYTYPVITPTLNDSVLVTDVSSSNPNNQTKSATLQSIKEAIDVVDSLNGFTGDITIGAGSGISVNNSTQGNIGISNTGVLSIAATTPLSASSSTGAVTISIADPLMPSDGGTGLTTYDTGDMLYYANGPGLSKLNIGSAGEVLKVNSNADGFTWESDSQGATGSGITGEIALWDGSVGQSTSALSGSIMTQVGAGNTAKIVIGGNPNNGLTFENTGSGIPDVTLLPFNGSSGANWEMRLPAPPSIGGQVMSLPSTLGSSPYQLEWTTPPVGTVTGTGTQFAIPFWSTTEGLGDSIIAQAPATDKITISGDVDIETSSGTCKLDVKSTNAPGFGIRINSGEYQQSSPSIGPIGITGGGATLQFGTENSGQNFDFKNNKIVFDSDTTNTFIQADTTTPESLEIHADEDIELRADNYVVIKPGIGVPPAGLDLGQKGSITFDDDYLYIAIDDDDWKKVALSAL